MMEMRQFYSKGLSKEDWVTIKVELGRCPYFKILSTLDDPAFVPKS